MNSKNSLTVLHSDKLHLHPCSVEKFPSEVDVYAAGMYELDEATKTRAGCVSIYESPGKLLNSHSVDAGILDMKFNGSYLGCALSTSRLYVIKYGCKVAEDGRSIDVKSVFTTNPDENSNDGLFLSLDWSVRDRAVCDESCFIAASTQNGAVKLFNCDETSGSSEDCSLHLKAYKSLHDIHKLHGEVQPVWTVAFDPHSHTGSGSCPNALITGGDDSMFKLWDVRTMNDGHDRMEGSSGHPTAIGKYHQAGVTTATYHPANPHVVVTGSYDQCLCVWDKRNLRAPVTAVETDGGVWRIKWGALNASAGAGVQGVDYLFLSCMQGGSMVYSLDCSSVVSTADDSVFQKPLVTDPTLLEHVITHLPGNANTPTDDSVSITDVDSAPIPIAKGQEHLAYGIDVIRYQSESNAVGKFTVASCSFYDNRLYEWELAI